MSKSKAKGTAAETAVVRYLREQGFEQAERRALHGTADRGDIAGVVGTVIEVKNCARMELAGWLAEAAAEADNDGARLGVVWHKRRGKGSPGDWFVTMDGATFVRMLREYLGIEAPPRRHALPAPRRRRPDPLPRVRHEGGGVMDDPTSRTVAALVHADCGHVAGVADDHETLREQAKALRVSDPKWQPADLDADDAIERLLAGACHLCRIERTP